MQRSSLFIILLFILSLCWSATFLFVKIGDATIPPFTLMAGRAIFAFLFLLAASLVSKKPLKKYLLHGKAQLVFIFAASTIAYMWFTIAKSEQVLTAAMASFLLTTLVIFSWIIATFFTKEKPFRYLNLFGIILAVIGVITMLGYSNIFHGNKNIWYALLYASGIALFVIGAAVTKHSGLKIHPTISTTYNLFYTAIILIIFALIFENPLSQSYPTSGLLSMLGVGFISTGIGYIIFFWLVVEAGQVFAAMNGYLVPIFGFLMGIGFLHEPFEWHQIIGLLIVFIGTFITDRKKVHRTAC